MATSVASGSILAGLVLVTSEGNDDCDGEGKVEIWLRWVEVGVKKDGNTWEEVMQIIGGYVRSFWGQKQV